MIAMIVDVAVRMLIKRPTVARIAAGDSRLSGRIPARAIEPRTEMILPNSGDETASAIFWNSLISMFVAATMRTRC